MVVKLTTKFSYGSDANCLNLASIDADLQEVVSVWNSVPYIIRQAILVLAHSPVRREE